MQLSTKTALVTGASSGIGLAIARSLLEQQCQVVGIARDFSKCELDSDGFEGVSLDLEDLEYTDKQLKSLCQQHHFDYFIHSSGSGLFGSIEQFSVQQIDGYLRSNLSSALVISRRLVPHMRRHQSGRILFIGSESAINAGKKGALYSTAKFGLRGLAQSLREDCSRDGITVSLINPGMVRTAFFDQQNFRPAAGADNAIRVEDIAELVLHILSSSTNLVFDEINLSPRNKSIDFTR